MADIREVPVALAQLCPVVLFCGEPCVLYYIEDHGKILFIWNLDPAVLIRIVPPENISQPLQYNTALDEVIEGHLSLPLAVELLYQCAVELVR